MDFRRGDFLSKLKSFLWAFNKFISVETLKKKQNKTKVNATKSEIFVEVIAKNC